MTIEEKQKEIVGDFEFLDDWMDKYEMIIQMGKELPPMDESDKIDQNLIKGCQSRVWIKSNYKDGIITFSADSDALITKGLVSLVLKVLSGHSPKEIMDAELHFVNDIGLSSHLSPTRSNGLLSMLKQIKNYAIAYNSMENK
ncbi:SufE family protein [Haoranjiania flava]|uniref:SufE family protein n=1 Tax=Haoranjiania flava TaxID=1856322 RepID=A0AAE3LKJ6_9BACT|nr:SufE family protein [Haoranjiania flava]MCU7694992.1 SufE family protein [Haoranjiania flava]